MTGVRRADYGLPEDGVVFCAHAAVYKILPAVFAQWMALLARHPRSVLWLRAAAGRSREAAAPRRRSARHRRRAPCFRAVRPDPPLSRAVSPGRSFSRHVSVRRAYDGERCAVRGPARGHHRRPQLRRARIGEPVGRGRDRRPGCARPRRVPRDRRRHRVGSGARADIAASLRDASARSPLFDMDRYARAFEAALSAAWQEAALP